MNNKHTPGPWKLFRNRSSNAQSTHILMQRETRQYLMYVTEAPGMGNAGDPNMRLLEEAPNLFDALQWALSQIEDSLDPDHQAALEAANATLVRAGGEVPNA